MQRKPDATKKIDEIIKKLQTYSDARRKIRKEFLIDWLEKINQSQIDDNRMMSTIVAMLVIHYLSIDSITSGFKEILREILNELPGVYTEDLDKHVILQDHREYLNKLKAVSELERSRFKYESIKKDDVAPYHETIWVLNDKQSLDALYDIKHKKHKFVNGMRSTVESSSDAGVNEDDNGHSAARDCNRSMEDLFVNDQSWYEVNQGDLQEGNLAITQQTIDKLKAFITKYLLSKVDDPNMKRALCDEYLKHIRQGALVEFHYFLKLLGDNRSYFFGIKQPLINHVPIKNGFVIYIENPLTGLTLESASFSIQMSSFHSYFALIKSAISFTAVKTKDSDEYQFVMKYVRPTSIHCLSRDIELLIQQFNTEFPELAFVQSEKVRAFVTSSHRIDDWFHDLSENKSTLFQEGDASRNQSEGAKPEEKNRYKK